MKELLMVFVKNVVPGQVKTRLAASIGAENAMKVYQLLLAHTLNSAKMLPCDKVVYYSNYLEEDDSWSKAGFRQCVQEGPDLGEKMLNAFRSAFEEGYSRVVIIGSDCYQLRTAHLEEAFASLAASDVVIGPAHDGGYYLLGMKSLHERLFKNKQWSSALVFSSTMQDIRHLKASCHVLATLSDVDNESDLKTSGILSW